MGDDDDLIAALAEPLDRAGQAAPDVGRLRRVEQQDPHVSEPADEELVELAQDRRLAEGLDRHERRDRAQQAVDRQEEPGQDGHERNEERPEDPGRRSGRLVAQDAVDDAPDATARSEPGDHRRQPRRCDIRGPPGLGDQPLASGMVPVADRDLGNVQADRRKRRLEIDRRSLDRIRGTNGQIVDQHPVRAARRPGLPGREDLDQRRGPLEQRLRWSL
jgi:hypothetical protein